MGSYNLFSDQGASMNLCEIEKNVEDFSWNMYYSHKILIVASPTFLTCICQLSLHYTANVAQYQDK